NHPSPRVPRGQIPVRGREPRKGRVPSRLQFTPQRAIQSGRQLPIRRPIGIHGPLPLGPEGSATGSNLGEFPFGLLRYQELRAFGPAIVLLGQPDFLGTEGLPMSFERVVLVGTPKSDVGAGNDERGPVLVGAG